MASNYFEPDPIYFESIPGSFASPTNNQRRFSSEHPASFASKKTQLRVGFQLSEYSIVCGRGKDTFNHVGNQRFRALASMFMERYSRAVTKAAKSAIVSEIIDVIHQADGNFCKFTKGVWVEVGEHCAREKVGSLLRDLLHTQYRSSAKAKISRRKTGKTGIRKQNQEEQSDQKLVDDTLHSDASSTSSLRWGSTKDSLGFEYWLEDDFFDIDVF
jgi:hypothetical protein